MADRALRDRIPDEMKNALRAGDKNRLRVIRLIHAAIRQKEIDDRTTLDDAQVHAVLGRMVKQCRDSIVQFGEAGRQDLVDKESFEVDVIQEFLPASLGEDELETIIRESIAEAGASSPKELGKVMKVIQPRVLGRADLGRVSARIREILQE